MRDKKAPSKLTVGIVVVVVALGVATGLVWKTQSNDNKSNAQQSATSSQNSQTNKTDTVSYDGVEGKNALELLKAKADVVTKQSAYGEYVDTVNGVAGGTDGKYWTFFVNGQMAQVGAADYQTKAGDKIEWKFQ